MEARPGRFGMVYKTPPRMTSSERPLLYCVLFARRLIIWGGLRPIRYRDAA